MPITNMGIFLPNGRFLPNYGDGHGKNAMRFCQPHKELNKLMWEFTKESKDNPDDFLLEAGCLIVASYQGKFGIKVASDNDNAFFKECVEDYQKIGYSIWPYWKMNNLYKEKLNEVLANEPKMSLIVRPDYES